MNRSFPPFRKTPTLPDDANWLLGVAAVGGVATSPALLVTRGHYFRTITVVMQLNVIQYLFSAVEGDWSSSPSFAPPPWRRLSIWLKTLARGPSWHVNWPEIAPKRHWNCLNRLNLIDSKLSLADYRFHWGALEIAPEPLQKWHSTGITPQYSESDTAPELLRNCSITAL